jgi:RimJ/RimL family protein N-acetyltransferase
MNVSLRKNPQCCPRDAVAKCLLDRAASDNVGSLRVPEKAGFRRIGVNRDDAHGRGEEIEETILRLDGGRCRG